jgi:WD40 repeat protein
MHGRSRLIALHMALNIFYQRHLETIDMIAGNHSNTEAEKETRYAFQLPPSMAAKLLYNRKYTRAITDYMGYDVSQLPFIELTGHTSRVTCVVQLSDGRLCGGSYDGIIYIWDGATGACQTAFEGHRGDISDVLQLADGRLCSGSHDGYIRVWSLTIDRRKVEGEHEAELSLYTPKKVLCVIQLHDGRICSASRDNTYLG